MIDRSVTIYRAIEALTIIGMMIMPWILFILYTFLSIINKNKVQIDGKNNSKLAYVIGYIFPIIIFAIRGQYPEPHFIDTTPGVIDYCLEVLELIEVCIPFLISLIGIINIFAKKENKDYKKKILICLYYLIVTPIFRGLTMTF